LKSWAGLPDFPVFPAATCSPPLCVFLTVLVLFCFPASPSREFCCAEVKKIRYNPSKSGPFGRCPARTCASVWVSTALRPVREGESGWVEGPLFGPLSLLCYVFWPTCPDLVYNFLFCRKGQQRLDSVRMCTRKQILKSDKCLLAKIFKICMNKKTESLKSIYLFFPWNHIKD